MTEHKINFIVSEDLKSGFYLTNDNHLIEIEDGKIVSVSNNPYKDGGLPIVLINGPFKKVERSDPQS